MARFSISRFFFQVNLKAKKDRYAFITFREEEALLECLNNIHSISGRKLVVARAKSQAEPQRTINNKCDIKKLFVGGIPALTTLKEFEEYFFQFGEIVDVMLPLKNDSLLNLGFGFVTFKNSSSAVSVLNSELKHSFRGKLVT